VGSAKNDGSTKTMVLHNDLSVRAKKKDVPRKKGGTNKQGKGA